MTYATIMVHVDRGPDAGRRIELACDLSDRFNSRLIGIAARRSTRPPLAIMNPFGDLLLGEADDGSNASIHAVEHVFQKIAGHRNGIKFRSCLDEPSTFLAHQARAADLVIVGRQAKSDPNDDLFGIDPGDLVLALGRPLLIVPPKLDRLRASRVLVAWKDTREARRAVRDALPLLTAADEVLVVGVDEEGESQGISDVTDFLCHHGVEAEAHKIGPPELSVVDELVKAAIRHKADLIVAGAYGYSRMREQFFGGATRDLMLSSPICCLVSH